MDQTKRKEILAQLDQWLATWPAAEPLPEGLDPALAEADEETPDLAGLAAAVLACRKDIQIQGKAFKRLHELLEPNLDRWNKPAEEALLLDLLDLADRLSRCVTESRRTISGLSFFSRLGGTQRRLQGLLGGITLIGERLTGILRGRGVTAMETTGKPFDPETMRALSKVTAARDLEAGTVQETTRTGYMLENKLLRPAEVRVAR